MAGFGCPPRLPVLRVGLARDFDCLSDHGAAIGRLLAHEHVFNGDDVFAASVSEFVVRTSTTRRLWIGSDFVLALSGLRGNKPHVAFASEFVFRGDLECFNFAVSDLAFVE